MEPIRSCIACRGREEWSNLLHLVLRENRVVPDPNRSQDGRGAWIHPKCFPVAQQRHAFNRAFKTELTLSLHEVVEYLEHESSWSKNFSQEY